MSLLDNPTWNALSTIQASFAEGNEHAKRYHVDIAPFAATHDQSSQSYESLARLLGPAGTAALTHVAMPTPPVGWTILHTIRLAQMVFNPQEAPPVKHVVESLDLSNIDEMLALVELAKPGPFSKRTPELGSYFGIREAGRLVAMAGERRRLPGFTEISGVCTSPGSRGRGFASSVVSTLIRKITARGDTPFLHVKTENVGAVRVYETLGFKTRGIINTVFVKKE